MKKILFLMVTLLATIIVEAREQKFPKIHIRGLEKHSGQKVDIYYVSGRPASIGTIGQKININKVWNMHKGLVVPPEGQMNIEATEVVNKFGIAFNYVIFVVYDKKQNVHVLQNADWSCPGMPDDNHYRPKKELCKGSPSHFKSILRKEFTTKNLQKNISNGEIEINLN